MLPVLQCCWVMNIYSKDWLAARRRLVIQGAVQSYGFSLRLIINLMRLLHFADASSHFVCFCVTWPNTANYEGVLGWVPVPSLSTHRCRRFCDLGPKVKYCVCIALVLARSLKWCFFFSVSQNGSGFMAFQNGIVLWNTSLLRLQEF